MAHRAPLSAVTLPVNDLANAHVPLPQRVATGVSRAIVETPDILFETYPSLAIRTRPTEGNKLVGFPLRLTESQIAELEALVAPIEKLTPSELVRAIVEKELSLYRQR